MKSEPPRQMQRFKYCGADFCYGWYGNRIYLDAKQCFNAADIFGPVKRDGYGEVLNFLNQTNLNKTGLFVVQKQNKKRWIWLHALKAVLGSQRLFKKKNKCKNAFLQGLLKQTFCTGSQGPAKHVNKQTKNVSLRRRLADTFGEATVNDVQSSERNQSNTNGTPETPKDTNSPIAYSTPLASINNSMVSELATSDVMSDNGCNDMPDVSTASFSSKDISFSKESTVPVGTVHLLGRLIPYTVFQRKIYLSVKPVLEALHIDGHISRKGYGSLDRCLEGMESSFLPLIINPHTERTHIWILALHKLCLKLKRLADLSLLQQLQVDILHALESISVENAEKKLGTKASKSFIENAQEFYGSDTKSLVNDLVKAFSKSSGNSSGLLSKKDLSYFLHKMKNVKYFSECIAAAYSAKHELTPLHLVYLQSNFSGTALFRELRKILPWIIPTCRDEQNAKKLYLRSFQAVLVPQRLPTGWAINPARLLEVLLYKYPFLPNEGLKMKLFGDGRDYGGRHSVFLAMSFINDELYLNDISYQSPKEMYELALFYESDSRDNLEENLMKPNFVADFITNCNGNNAPAIEFYLTGDEMFNVAMLDGQGALGPLTPLGWNLYSVTGTSQKSEVSPSGLRTELKMSCDRECPEAILPPIKVDHVRFCLLHGLARVVEKLLSLVVERNILSEKSKMSITPQNDMTGEDLLRNLENNVNKRGVRHGKFSILFDKSGKHEPIKLNKDAANRIICPVPAELQGSVTHVLTNVLSNVELTVPFPDSIINYLGLPHKMTEFSSIAMIWQSFHTMYSILRSEPEPVLRDDAPEGSTRASDYTWGYTAEHRKEYLKTAETFYQLYKWRYGADCFTPYMLKFVDYAPLFMAHGEIPLCRFQAEGAEHLNYTHGSFYYTHTNRHGGANHIDPLLSIFKNRWIKLMYEIRQADRVIADDFNLYIDRHVAALIIQKYVRGFLARKYVSLVKSTLAESPSTELSLLPPWSQQSSEVTQQASLFAGLKFFLAGSVAKNGKTKMNQESVTKIIKDLGGRVAKQLPVKTKGKSTKLYIVLYERPGPKSRIPIAVKQAISKGYPILSYQFLYKSAECNTILPKDQFRIDLPCAAKRITREVSLQRLHFSKQTKFVSVSRRKCRTQKFNRCSKLPNPIPNAPTFFAIMKRKEYASEQRAKLQELSFKDFAILHSKYFKLWKSLAPDSADKILYTRLWKEHCVSVQNRRQKILDLIAYNAMKRPLYKNTFSK